MRIYSKDKIDMLVTFNNYIVTTFGIPSGSLVVQLNNDIYDDVYGLEWATYNGTLTIASDDIGTDLMYSYCVNSEEGSGNIDDKIDLIVDKIKELNE